MYDIIIGRSDEDLKKFGKSATAFIGKQYVKMGNTTSLSNNIYLDVSGPHVVFICGKRGSGKSYTMGAIAEGIISVEPTVKENLSVVILDTMGIYWTMKYPNLKDKELLSKWDLEGKGYDVKVFVPTGYYDLFKKKGIPVDYPFSIIPSELSAADWCNCFGLDQHDPTGVIIEKTVYEMKSLTSLYDIDDIIEKIRNDEEILHSEKLSAINRFKSAKSWGLFSKDGTSLSSIISAGNVSVIDVSCYATIPGSEGVKNLAIGIVAQKLFLDRMETRRGEEFEELNSSIHYYSAGQAKQTKEKPLVWIVIDEAHEFLPNKGKTAAMNSLITILREGRQPGISLILATQQPGKIHTDVMTQSDVVISHRLTAKMDVDSLALLMQSYMREGLDKIVSNVPKTKGSAMVFDDYNERIISAQIRPRTTWHGGGSPSAIPTKKNIF